MTDSKSKMSFLKDKSTPDIISEGFALGPVLLVVDTRCEGVDVPEYLHGVPNLQLSFSPRFDARDLTLGDESISQTLTFNGNPYHVSVPYSAIMAYKLGNGDVGLFLESLPKELMDLLVVAVMSPQAPINTKKGKSTLRVIQ